MHTRSSFLESMGPLAAMADGEWGPSGKPCPIDAIEIADLCWFTIGGWDESFCFRRRADWFGNLTLKSRTFLWNAQSAAATTRLVGILILLC